MGGFLLILTYAAFVSIFAQVWPALPSECVSLLPSGSASPRGGRRAGWRSRRAEGAHASRGPKAARRVGGDGAGFCCQTVAAVGYGKCAPDFSGAQNP